KYYPYKAGVYRIGPTTVEAFINSPIYLFIIFYIFNIIENISSNQQLFYITLQAYHPNMDLSWHDDFAFDINERDNTYFYYVNSIENFDVHDGGCLKFSNQYLKQNTKINK